MTTQSFTNRLLIALFTFCLACSACKKEKEDLIIGSWKMTGYIHNGADVYNTQVPPCVTDNIITFTSNKKITSDEGPTKCDATDPQTESGTYSFNADRTQLTVVANGSSEVHNIQTLNTTTLKIEQTSNGDLVTYTKQ